jgi:shikimate kinase
MGPHFSNFQVGFKMRGGPADEGVRVASMKDRRIIILGFMACGKTTVARELARQIKVGVVDLDSFVCDREGRSAAEIIAADGEPAFREIETRALNDVLTNSDARIISLGGGTWTIPGNRTLIALHDCVTVWLDAPFDLCWQRIIDGGETVRPLAPDHETALHRYEARRADYALAENRVVVSALDDQETIANQILPLC